MNDWDKEWRDGSVTRVDYFELSRFGNTDDSSSFLGINFHLDASIFPRLLL